MEAPVGKPYDGPSGVGRDSIWLTNEDLIEGKDVTLQIKDVILYPKVKFEGGREKLNMIGLSFAGKSRVLGLNATNRKTLNKMFGNITKLWKGQSITLFVTETQFAGETVKCLRIRNQRSRAATVAEEVLGGDDEPTTTTSPDVDLTSAELTDEQAWREFCRLAALVNKEFNDERPVIRETPAKSGLWHLVEPELEQGGQVYDANQKQLNIPRESLAALAAKLRRILS